MVLSLRRTRHKGRIEKALRDEGKACAGVDEVGRGCLAGPVAAGFAVLDLARVEKLKSADRRLLRDSKLLSHAQRQYVLTLIAKVQVDTQVGWASVAEIEQIGILPACFLAMRRAITAGDAKFDVLLVDGKLKLRGYEGEQQPVVKGDALCFSIAAASIVAKEARDAYMREQARTYPVYGFDEHVGYGTRRHLDSLREHGACALHRKNFDPVRAIVQPFIPDLPAVASRGELR